MSGRLQITRATFSQEVREFYRNTTDRWVEVQLVVPESPNLFIDVDRSADDLGPNRSYKMPPVPSNAMVRFPLAPGQFLVGAVDEGMMTIAVFVYPILAGRM